MASPGLNRLLLMTEREVKEMPPYLQFSRRHNQLELFWVDSRLIFRVGLTSLVRHCQLFLIEKKKEAVKHH